jgi:hypothetical protein
MDDVMKAERRTSDEDNREDDDNDEKDVDHDRGMRRKNKIGALVSMMHNDNNNRTVATGMEIDEQHEVREKTTNSKTNSMKFERRCLGGGTIGHGHDVWGRSTRLSVRGQV